MDLTFIRLILVSIISAKLSREWGSDTYLALLIYYSTSEILTFAGLIRIYFKYENLLSRYSDLIYLIFLTSCVYIYIYIYIYIGTQAVCGKRLNVTVLILLNYLTSVVASVCKHQRYGKLKTFNVSSFNIRRFQHSAWNLIHMFLLLSQQAVEWQLEGHHFCGTCCPWTSSADELFS